MQRPRQTLLVLAVLVTTAVTACASGAPSDDAATSDDASTAEEPTMTTTDASSGEPTESASTSAPEPGSPAPTSSAASLPDGGLTFARTGGIAGVDDELVVQPDGSFTLRHGDGTRDGTLEPGQLATLATALAELDWAELEAAASGTAADDDYQFVVSAGDHTVEIAGSQLPKPAPELFVVAQELLKEG